VSAGESVGNEKRSIKCAQGVMLIWQAAAAVYPVQEVYASAAVVTAEAVLSPQIPGVATTIWLSSYSPYDTYAFTQDSEQIKWLKKTLSAVDRRSTPWLVVIWHAPW